METLVMIMAGGKGSRLAPLTTHRAKPAVPFGGRYRIIDFALSNLVNSGYRNVYVLTQYMASSLIKHLNRNWNVRGWGMFVEPVPAQMRRGEHWYVGTADAVFQNLNLVRDAHCKRVAVFGGDHIYRFEVRQMEAFHIDKRADLTIAAFRVPREDASQFGVIKVDESGRIIGFEEKPEDPSPIPGRPDTCLVSMGNYFFETKVLEDRLEADDADTESSHDFGKNIIPQMVADGAAVFAYDFNTNRIPGDEEPVTYWRDVGTIDSYFAANMDLRSQLPGFNLYNRRWPIRTAARNFPPAKFVRDGGFGRSGELVDSLVCEGTIVCSSSLFNVMTGYDCHFHSNSQVDHAVILSGCNVGAGSRLRRVLMDKNCSVAAGSVVGYDEDVDKARFPFRTESGIIVLPKGTHVPATGPIEFAKDMAVMLRNDKMSREWLDRFEGTVVTTTRSRHSHDSAASA